MSSSEPGPRSDERPPIEPAAVLGAFLGVFGTLVLVAIAFTPTTRGRVTNLACGLVLLAVAGVLFLAASSNRRT